MAAYAVLTTAGHTVTTTQSTISWNAAVEVGGEWWNSDNPTRLVVPAGVSLIELVFVCLNTTVVSSMDALFTVRINGVDTFNVIVDSRARTEFGYSLGVYSVTPGDYFEITTDRFTGSNRPLDTTFTRLSAFDVTDIEGVVAAQLTSDTSVGGAGATLSWTVSADTLTTHNGTTTFTVPAGVSAARVALAAKGSGSSNDATYEVRVNGVAVRRQQTSVDFWAPGEDFGLIGLLSPGDEITIHATVGLSTLDASWTRLSIQWFGDAALPVPAPGDYVAGFHVTRLATTGLTDGGVVTYDNVRLADNMTLSAPLTTITVPAGASVLVTGAHTRNVSPGSTFWGIAIDRNTTEQILNAQHDGGYNTGIANAIFPVTPGDTVRVRIAGNGVMDTQVCDWWGKFYA